MADELDPIPPIAANIAKILGVPLEKPPRKLVWWLENDAKPRKEDKGGR